MGKEEIFFCVIFAICIAIADIFVDYIWQRKHRIDERISALEENIKQHE